MSPYITEAEAKHFEALRNAQREEEEANELDLDDYDLTTAEGNVQARMDIEKMPQGVQEMWLNRLSDAVDDQVETSHDTVPGPLDTETREQMHAELAEAKNEEEAAKILAAHGQAQ